jgi:hypothetical protein
MGRQLKKILNKYDYAFEVPVTNNLSRSDTGFCMVISRCIVLFER